MTGAWVRRSGAAWFILDVVDQLDPGAFLCAYRATAMAGHASSPARS